MRQLTVLVIVIVVALFSWQLAIRLSADALGMAVGMIFGILAGVPLALLNLAANRRRPIDDDDDARPTTNTMNIYVAGDLHVHAQLPARAPGERPAALITCAPRLLPAPQPAAFACEDEDW